MGTVISVTTALLGIVAFFLPWLQFSCRQVSMTASVSGYELATGSFERRLDAKRSDEFWNRLDARLDSKRSTRRPSSSPKSKTTSTPPSQHRRVETMPILWIVPGACALLAILGVFGLPRTATALVSAAASAYFAYVGVSLESQANDPAITGGILAHDWLPAFWATWVALLLPVMLSHVRVRDEEDSVSDITQADTSLSIR